MLYRLVLRRVSGLSPAAAADGCAVITRIILPAAYELLPDKMCWPEADAMLIAIGLQESRFEHRRQIRGPARGFWQFEKEGGVKGVMTHPASKDHAASVLEALKYPKRRAVIHEALADNDILAACFARLLLYTDPEALPRLDDDPEISWRYYLRNWRPGKPHRRTWDKFWSTAIYEVQIV